MNWLRTKWEDFKAWRRGEVRVKEGRGRCYAKKDGEQSGPAQEVSRTRAATITAKVTRADGSIEIHKATNVRIEHGDRSHDSRP